MISDTFIDNVFDPALNNFQTIRRTADIYEWGAPRKEGRASFFWPARPRAGCGRCRVRPTRGRCRVRADARPCSSRALAGNTVLIPGLFANAGPCAAAVGATGAFASATDRPTPTNFSRAMLLKGCNDDAWPDGSGAFHLHDATPYSAGELAEAFDMLDWTEGIVFKTARVQPLSATACHTSLISGACLHEIGATNLLPTSLRRCKEPTPR